MEIDDISNSINSINKNIDNLVQCKSKGKFSRNQIVYIGELLNSAYSLLHFQLDRAGYYDGAGSMDVWVNGRNGMMCVYSAHSIEYLKNVSCYKKGDRVYVYVTAPNYNDNWSVIDCGTCGDAHFDCKLVSSLPTDADLIYDLKTKKGLFGKGYHNGNKLITNSDLYGLYKPIYGTVVTNSVPSQTGTTVNKLVLEPGIYVIYGFASYNYSFPSCQCNYGIHGVPNYVICRNTGSGGGGQTPFCIQELTERTTVSFILWQGDTVTRNLDNNRLVAIKLA